MCDKLIQELLLYKFEVGYNAMEATKNICFAKGEGIAWFGFMAHQIL